MSQKNSRENKKRRKVLKSLRAPLPAYIDLIDYVKVRTRCTTATAQKVCLSGALMVDSHPVGYKWEKRGKESVKVLDPYLPADKYSSLRVVKPKDENYDRLGLAVHRSHRDA